MNIHRLARTLALLLLASPALAGTPRCTTYEHKTLHQLYTVRDDGSRAVSTWSPTLQQWTTTVTPPPSTEKTQIRPQPKASR